MNAEIEQPLIERYGEDGRPSILRYQREPALLGIAEELVRASAEVVNRKDIQGFHRQIMP